MIVIYEKPSGNVVAVRNGEHNGPQPTVELSEENISRPITGTVVDDVDNPTKTVNDLTKIKSKKKSQIKNEAYNRLEPFDWYVIREQEEGTAIPTEVSQYRSDVRSTEDNATATVDAATSASEVRSIDPNWPSEPNV